MAKRRKSKEPTPKQQVELLQRRIRQMEFYAQGVQEGARASTVRVVMPKTEDGGLVMQALRGINTRLEALEHDILLVVQAGHVARDQAQARKLFGEE